MSDVGRKGGSIAVALLMMWAGFLSIGMTFSTNVKAPTWVGGHITGNETWTEANSPYYVVDTITVDPGASLTIEAGVSVRFTYNPWPPYSLIIYGTLKSMGNPNKSVTLTSNLTMPFSPSWGNITVHSAGKAEIYYTNIEYGDEIILHSDRNIIDHSTISKVDNGIKIYSSYNTIYESTVEYSNITGVYYQSSMSGNVLQNSTIKFNGVYGIYLDYITGSSNRILGNQIWGNGNGGIRAYDANGWEIACNLVTANNQWGIRTQFSNLTVHHNNVLNHTDNAYDHQWVNRWDDGSEGNYWDDYNGTDMDGDGIGDTPYYILPENQDSYPFVNQVVNCPSWGPQGQPPVAVARPSTQTVDVGQSAWFNGSDSYDPDGWIVSYYWTFGDGGSAWSENVSHSYSLPGTYTVSLKVTDNDNLTDIDYVTVTVNGYPPVADAGPDQTVYAKQWVELNGSGSYDTDGWITDWLWDFGDGSLVGHGEVVYHKYQNSGNYTATLTVTDNHNLTDSDTAYIDVLPELQWPVSDPDGPYSGRKNFPLLLTGNGSYDPDGSIVDLEWDFGDGSPREHGWFLEHTYTSGGNFTVTLWVTDNDGLVNVSTTFAFIEDMEPGAAVILDAVLSGGSNEDVTFSWTLSPDDSGIENDVVGYEIYYGTSYDKDGLGYSLLDTVPSGTTTYTHTDGGHSDNNTYFYVVKAVDDIGQKSFEGQAVKLARHLPTGMQLISIPVLLSNTTVQDVFKTVDFKVIRYYDAMAGKRHNWKTFDTRKPYNSLTNVNEKMALWVDITKESHLVAAGLVPVSTTIRLVVGWNFIGYASFFDAAVGDTFAGATYQNVEGFDPTDPPWFLMRLSDTGIMAFGNGYWIHVSEEFEWTVTN